MNTNKNQTMTNEEIDLMIKKAISGEDESISSERFLFMAQEIENLEDNDQKNNITKKGYENHYIRKN